MGLIYVTKPKLYIGMSGWSGQNNQVRCLRKRTGLF